MDFKGEEQDSCPTLPLASVDAKFQIALAPRNTEKALLVGKGLGNGPISLSADKRNKGPSIEPSL